MAESDGKVIIDVDLDDKKFKSSLDKMDKNAKSSFGSIGKTIGGMGTAIAGVGTAIAGGLAVGVGALVGIAEITREFRGDLAKLETVALTTGTSMDGLSDHMAYLYAVTGEVDSNVEGLANLMQSGFNETQIEQAVEGLAGAVISFPDTLKFEGLADSLQETIATGKGMGQFGELLVRTGVDINVFNAEMAGATTEVKRQSIALDYLANTGMAGINEAYKETNGVVISAQEAQYKLNEQMARIGEIVDPLVTLFKVDLVDALASMITAYEEGGLTGLVESTSELVTGLITQFMEQAPQMIEVAFEFINSLIQGFSDNGELIGESAVTIVTSLITGILESIPLLIEASANIIVGLAQGLIDNIPTLVEKIPEILTGIVDAIVDNLDMIVDVALELMETLADSLLDRIPVLLETAPEMIEKLVSAITENLPKIIKVAGEIIVDLVKGIIDNLPKIIESASEIIGSLVGGIGDLLPDIIEIAGDIVSALWDTLINTNWLQLGADIIGGIISGLFSMVGNVLSAVGDIASSIFSGFTDFFGISSPSKLMENDFGKWLLPGAEIGVKKSIPQTKIKLNADMDEVFSSLKVAPNIGIGVGGSNTVNNNDNGIIVNVAYTGTGNTQMDVKAISRAIGQETQRELRSRGLVQV